MTIYKSVGKFLSTPSARRATRAAGGWLISLREFLSTPSARRATRAADRRAVKVGHFYPRPPRGGRRIWCYVLPVRAWISIHALREEGDASAQARAVGRIISIHALREEGDEIPVCKEISMEIFLSTPSARRATAAHAATCFSFLHFYPRPPRGGRLLHCHTPLQAVEISIHALREEGDFYIAILLCRQ